MTPTAGNPHPELQKRLPGLYMGMGDTAEIVAKRYKVSREVQDEYALLSQQRTARAQRGGFFEGEIAPMEVTMSALPEVSRVRLRDYCSNRADSRNW